jgi:hypothetical protein
VMVKVKFAVAVAVAVAVDVVSVVCLTAFIDDDMFEHR